ncbi:complement C1q-like protein 4 [Mytilus edulis]|uniref:complement C1q-like protein 4 n=1 Tax=Mytilus edulis TaxID=6550 RepID=UPI0039EED773
MFQPNWWFFVAIVGHVKRLEDDVIELKERDVRLSKENEVLRKQNAVIMEQLSLVTTDIRTLKQEHENLKRQMRTFKKTSIFNKSNGNMSLPFDAFDKRQLTETPVHRVAFLAALTREVSLGYHQQVEFDKIITNEGRAYSSSDGHFIAPYRGLYLLSTTLFNTEGHTLPMEIVRNGIQLAAMFLDNDDYNMASQTVLVVLQQGDRLWVRRFRDSGSANLDATPTQLYNTFSGVLLYEM